MASDYKLVTIYLNEADEWQDRPLYLEFLEFLSRSGCAGATVMRAVAGFTAGLSSVPTSLEETGRKLPIVVQFVDRAKKVREVLPELRRMAVMRLITVQPVGVISAAEETAPPTERPRKRRGKTSGKVAR